MAGGQSRSKSRSQGGGYSRDDSRHRTAARKGGARNARNKSGRRVKIVVGLVLIAVAVLLVVVPMYRREIGALLPAAAVSQTTSDATRSAVAPSTALMAVSDEMMPPVPTVSSDGLASSNAILFRLSDGQVLMEKDADAQIYPASLTKVMTVLVALQHIDSLETPITVSGDDIDLLTSEDAALAGFLPGEQVRAIDLMYGALLPSDALSALTLAKAVAGSEEEFASLMNDLAGQLGMTGTHFTNATGLHDDDHYTTVRDMGTLIAYALKNATFRQIFTTLTYQTVSIDPMDPEGLALTSTLLSYGYDLTLSDGTIEGGKTGFTDQAGYCLISLAQVDGTEYVLVTAGAPNEGENFSDAVTVYDRIAG